MNKLVSNLQRLHDVLADTEFTDKYFLVGGLVLGYVREGNPIPHDKDADFGFFECSREAFRSAIPPLINAGFKKRYRWSNSQGVSTEYCFSRDNFKFEFFIHQFHPDGATSPANQLDPTMCPVEEKGSVRWQAYHGGRRIELVREMPARLLGRFRRVSFLARQWMIPYDVEGYLAAQYGNWRIKNPQYDYLIDCPANVYSGSWSGSRNWPEFEDL